VDDNADMRTYLKRLLSHHFTVYTATQGADAMQQLAGHVPQLILSDIMMPVMDGKELLRRVRQNPATAHIPMIFLSARAGQEARIDGLEAGADDYLVKPFSGAELISKIRALVTQDQSRRQVETRLRNLVQHAPVAMMLVKGEALTVELINQAMLELMQQTIVLGRPLVDALPGLDGQDIIKRFRQVYHTGVPDQGRAVEVPVWRNGQLETGYFNLLLTPYYEGNTLTGVLEICTEVTELIHTNQALSASEAAFRQLSADLDAQVQQRTAELQTSVEDLERSNNNLQQFAYIASHDLQEPLRKIQSFGTILSNQYADQLGNGVDHLNRMQSAASRMSMLIRDLLSFSRLITRRDLLAAVSLTELVATVLNDLELVIAETHAEIHVATLPTVPGDASQLGQLFQNLLSNAIKFRRKDITPVIHITS
ncbi:MAG: response regulator, partial [Cytophagaceae bacterium]